MSEERFLTAQQLAERWGVSARSVKRWHKESPERLPPAYALGHRGGFGQGVKFKLSEIEAFESASKNK